MVSPSPKVFISYSQDSAEHMQQVLGLSDRLRADGVDCEIDQYEQAPPEGWPRWMSGQIERADFVLVICTPTLAERFAGKGRTGQGLGAKWEGAIVTQELYEAEAHNTKFVPVLLDGDSADVPGPLRQTTRYDASTEEGYEALYRRLTQQPKIHKREVGRIRPLAARQRSGAFSPPLPAGAKEQVPATAGSPDRPRETRLSREALLALLETSNLLNETDTLDEVLTRCLELAGRLLDSTSGSVILHDALRDDLYFAAAVGPKRDEVLPRRIPRGRGKAGQVFETGAPLIENVVVGHYDTIDRDTDFRTQSMICVPIAHRERRFGVMQMLNKGDGRDPFTVEDLELLSRFGVQASLAIRRAHLFEQLLDGSGLYARPEVRREIVERLLRDGRLAMQERIAILSIDMRGFSRLCRELVDPGRVQQVLSDYVAFTSAAVVAEGGFLNKVVGDGLLGFFRDEGGPSRALRAALAIQRAFDDWLPRWRESTGRALSFLDVGMGIASGAPTMLGTVGDARFRDLTVVGDAVNLASALGKQGRLPARLWIDAATWEVVRAEPGLDFDGPERLGPRPNDDLDAAAPAYAIYRVSRHQEGPKTPGGPRTARS
ncbi:MAG: TIR domain-containing protein [Planctomycetes bacterium]|nr:TIR domain-containing protein [Planctomycetota bacterium]